MRRGGASPIGLRLLSAATSAATVLLAATVPAFAVTRPVPIPTRQATVDHPPADGVMAFDSGSRRSDRVALTFDADLSVAMLNQLRSGQVRSWYNQEIRQILDAEHVEATMFLTGLWAVTYPEVARSLAEDPLFEIGSHTWDHGAFRTPCYGLPPAADRVYEIARAEDEIQRVTGVRPLLLRFPGDCYERADAALARELGVRVVSGDVRAGDAFNTSAASIAANVLRSLQPGSIVVMHMQGGPNAPMTGPALRQVIAAARSRGLGFATVSELVGLRGRLPAVAPPSAEEVLAPIRMRSLGLPEAAPSEVALVRYRERTLRRPHCGGGRSTGSLVA